MLFTCVGAVAAQFNDDDELMNFKIKLYTKKKKKKHAATVTGQIPRRLTHVKRINYNFRRKWKSKN